MNTIPSSTTYMHGAYKDIDVIGMLNECGLRINCVDDKRRGAAIKAELILRDLTDFDIRKIWNTWKP